LNALRVAQAKSNNQMSSKADPVVNHRNLS
jgi:hypothetical protein